MSKNRVRSSHVELGPRHCPAAVAHARQGTAREPSHEMMIGKCAHAVHEAAAQFPNRPAAEVADAAAVTMCRDGLSFEGGKPEFPTLEQADEGKRLALRLLDKHPLPQATWIQAELEVNLTPNGWQVVRGRPCELCAVAIEDECQRCKGSRTQWPPHWHQLLDLAYQAEDIDVYENEVLIAGGRDLKGWNASAAWHDTLQGAGYAVSLASLFPSAEIIRRECAGYQLGQLFHDEIDLRTEEGQDRLGAYREALALAVRVHAGAPTDADAQAMPGPGCFGGFGGCPYFSRCEPAIYRAGELLQAGRILLTEPESTPLCFDGIEESAIAFALGSALAQEGARQLKSYGGGPIQSASGHWVGWRDSTSPTGNVEANAPIWLAREFATFALGRAGDADRVEGVLRAAKIGVTQVKALVKKCVASGMSNEDGEALLIRCLAPKPGRKLAIWRGPLPKVEKRPTLEEQLRASIDLAKES